MTEDVGWVGVILPLSGGCFDNSGDLGAFLRVLGILLDVRFFILIIVALTNFLRPNVMVEYYLLFISRVNYTAIRIP
jgi:hypothetical protein